MATNTRNKQVDELKAENARLRAELQQLQSKTKQLESESRPAEHGGRFFKRIGSIFLVSLAAALLLVGNLVFWVGNTIVKPDRFVAATSPIIEDPAVQKALATRIGDRLFSTVDVEQLATEVLPPRAEFIAPSIASQVENYTRSTIEKIIQRPRFQDRWNTILEKQHARLIRVVGENGSDASVDISEVYADASQSLQGTKLSFLAGRDLPPRVGNIELLSGGWVQVLNRTIQNIDAWRIITILLLIVSSVGGVWLARNRRKAVVTLGVLFAIVMFISAVSMRLFREMLAGKAEPQFGDAIRNAYSIFFHDLAIQTFTIMAAAIVIAIIAWISGNWRSSVVVREKLSQLFSGKIHAAMFGRGENPLTRWIGKYKRLLQWLVVAAVAIPAIFIRLTPSVLITQVIIIIVLVVLVEILAAEPETSG